MTINVTKMQGAGNDYIYVEADKIPQGVNLQQLSIRISDRHFGIGADGLVLIAKPANKENVATMRIFNADGSEAEMCGNASRCVGRYAVEHGWWINPQEPFFLETKAGIRTLRRNSNDELSVNIGTAHYQPIQVPTPGSLLKSTAITESLTDVKTAEDTKTVTNVKTAKELIDAHFVTVGNPHCIFFVDDINAIRLTEDGPKVENNTTLFPHRTNVEFGQVLDRHTIRLIVWERGSGITLACGTGATASAYAAHVAGLCDYPVTLQMPGGDLTVWEDEHGELILAGPATTVCIAEFAL